MKIENDTHYDTGSLRRICSRIAKAELWELSSAQRKRIRLHFVHCPKSSRGFSGYAYQSGTYARLRLPREITGDNVHHLASLIAHEMHHLSGKGGGQEIERAMRTSRRYGYSPNTKSYYAWATDYVPTIKVLVLKSKPSALDKANAHLERIAANVKRWETKKKRADAALAKYRKQTKYYEKRVVALAAAPPAEPKPRKPRTPRGVILDSEGNEIPRCISATRAAYVDEWLDHGGDDGRIEVWLKPGYSFEGETHCRYEDGVRDMQIAMGLVEPCECSECKDMQAGRPENKC